MYRDKKYPEEHPRNLIPELCRQFYHLGWVTGTDEPSEVKKQITFTSICSFPSLLSGIVTSVNTELCSFTLDNDVIIYLPHLILYEHLEGLPAIGEHVHIDNHHHQGSNDPKCIYLCEKSTIKCNCTHHTSISKCHLLQVIKKSQLQVCDILNINKHMRIIRERFPGFSATLVNVIVTLILEKLAELFAIDRNVTNGCRQGKVPEFSLNTVLDCQCVDACNEIYAEFPYWSFGVHHRYKSSDFFIGYFFISDTQAIPFIRDGKHSMRCCVITNNNKNLAKMHERLILVRKCFIFTEILNEHNVGTMEYMVCHMEDICIINACIDVVNGIKFYHKKPAGVLVNHTLEFVLLAKSSTIRMKNKQSQAILKILNTRSKRIEYLALSTLNIIPLLDVGSTYILHHNENLIEHFWDELQRIQESRTTLNLLVDPLAIITCKSVTNSSSESICTVAEVAKLIRTSSGLLSFQGVIRAKEFVKCVESRTATDRVAPGFGTLGSKTHVLHFSCPVSGSVKLRLYLNNCESIAMPLGLLPGVKLLVRNVLPQRGGYLKCTVLTTFTILGYEPAAHFQTINLCDGLYGCGELSYLGSGHDVDSSVLVKARVFDIRIQTACVRYCCKKCKKQVPCSCGSAESNVEISLTFAVNDQEGPSFVISKSASVLKILLGLNDFTWNVFLETLPSLLVFNYNEFYSKNTKTILLDEILQYSLDAWYSVSLTKLELVCRKLESKPQENDGLPLWYCVHAELLLS